MFGKGRKVLMAAGLGMAAMAAVSTSADAAVFYDFYDASGQHVGVQVYCDSGTLFYMEGIQTSIYTVRYDNTGPC